MTNVKPEDLIELKKEFENRGIPFVDRHTHSINKYTRSFDLSKKPIDGPSLEIVEFAARAGFDEIAITDHAYELLLYPKMKERTELQLTYGKGAITKYVQYLKEVKQKYKNLRVLGGIEIKIRLLEDLKEIEQNQFKDLDFIMIETPLKKPDFDKMRDWFGERVVIIFAHPDPRYSLGEDYNIHELDSFIETMSRNRIHFDLNRQFLDKFLSDDPIYEQFFKRAMEKGVLFSTGSDYHIKIQNYVRYFTKTLEVIKRYGFNKSHFLTFKK